MAVGLGRNHCGALLRRRNAHYGTWGQEAWAVEVQLRLRAQSCQVPPHTEPDREQATSGHLGLEDSRSSTAQSLWSMQACSKHWALTAAMAEHGGQVAHSCSDFIAECAGASWEAPAR